LVNILGGKCFVIIQLKCVEIYIIWIFDEKKKKIFLSLVEETGIYIGIM